MSFWTRFIEWCRRPDMIKIQRFNPGIGEKDTRTNPLQIGISIIMGWTIPVCAGAIQPIIHPDWLRFFSDWGMLLLGLGLTSWGIIQKGSRMANILLQTGVVVTIIWVFVAASSHNLGYVLGLPELYVTVGHARYDVPTHLFIVGFPVLGLILLASGIILKSINRSIKIRTFNPRVAVILMTFSIILAASISVGAWRVPPNLSEYTFIDPEDIETLTITMDTTLTEDYTGMIVIAADGVTLDGDGHMIIGPGPDVYIWDLEVDPNPNMEELDRSVPIGILLEGRTGVTVKNCRVTDFALGFYLNGSDENTLQRNTAKNNTNGFELDFSDGNILEANTAKNNTNGFELYESEGNIFQGNTANNNTFMGFSLVFDSDGNSLQANTANDNFACGFFSQFTSNNTFQYNTANGNYDGFYFHMSFGNTLQGNTANNNTNGFHVGCSSNNPLTGNTVSNNTSGMYFGEACPTNSSVYHNNFVNNVKQVNITNTDTVNAWDDGYPSGGNYWSDYTGVDANGDGIGDTPYVIDENNMDRYPLIAPFSVFDSDMEGAKKR